MWLGEGVVLMGWWWSRRSLRPSRTGGRSGGGGERNEAGRVLFVVWVLGERTGCRLVVSLGRGVPRLALQLGYF